MTVKRLIILYIALLLIPLSAIAADQYGFQKSNSIAYADDSRVSEINTDKYLDVRSFISSIPYTDAYNTERHRMVYTVMPYQRYIDTIVKGSGNCSNQVYGASYYLDQNNIDYQIIHILPKDSFMKGEGHTLLRVPVIYQDKKQVGLVDIAGANILESKGKILDIGDMNKEIRETLKIINLNEKRLVSRIDYYYLDEEAYIGYVSSQSVKQYFAFVEICNRVIPIKNKKLEKYVYDGLALVFDKYPKAYVYNADKLFMNNNLKRIFYIINLWIIRVLAFITPVVMLILARKAYVSIRNRIKEK